VLWTALGVAFLSTIPFGNLLLLPRLTDKTVILSRVQHGTLRQTLKLSS
jgi:hypothetical protein